MGWDSLSVKKLRRMLNWTPLQMSRRLGLDNEYYLDLEIGENPFTPEICVQLDLLQLSVDKHLNRIKEQPAAEGLLKKADTDQVSQSEIDDYIHELKKLDN